LTEEEYSYMLPNVKSVFFIKNGGEQSFFQQVEPSKLFEK